MRNKTTKRTNDMINVRTFFQQSVAPLVHGPADQFAYVRYVRVHRYTVGDRPDRCPANGTDFVDFRPSPYAIPAERVTAIGRASL